MSEIVYGGRSPYSNDVSKFVVMRRRKKIIGWTILVVLSTLFCTAVVAVSGWMTLAFLAIVICLSLLFVLGISLIWT